MYNFHICTSYMKSSKSFISLCVLILLIVCLLDLAIVRTSEEGEEKKGALNLVNKRTFDSKMFIR